MSEAAKALGVSKNTLYAALCSNEPPIQAVRIGRRWVIPKAPLMRMLGKEAA